MGYDILKGGIVTCCAIMAILAYACYDHLPQNSQVSRMETFDVGEVTYIMF